MPRVNLDYLILKEMADSGLPLGASYLALKLQDSQASQATLGRVLQKLEYQGYITKASNKGRILTESGRQYLVELEDSLHTEQNASELINLFSITDRQVYLDVLQTRILLEKHTAYQAALKAKPKQIAALERILQEQTEQQQQGSLGEEENLRFHAKIAEIAGNKVIEQLLNLIMTKKHAYRHFSVLHYRIAERNHNDHFTLLQAIKDHDPETAAHIMNNHLSALIRDSKRIKYNQD